MSRVVARGSGQSAHETPSTCAIERALFYRRCRSCSGENPAVYSESFDASPAAAVRSPPTLEFPRFRRSALRTARRRGDPTMAKKKKKSPATGKKSKHRFSHKQMDAPKEKPSAFEARSGQAQVRHSGSQGEGVKGNMLKARTAGVAKRRNTLLKEHDAAGKANAFLDRRFGEGDAGMTPEERSIGRLARARLRQLRPGKQSFALGDDDDGDAGTRRRRRRRVDPHPRRRSHRRGDPRASLRARAGARPVSAARRRLRLGGPRPGRQPDRDMTGALHFGGGDDGDGGGFSP